MILNERSWRRKKIGLTEIELKVVELFLQTAVDRWIKTRKGQFFSANELVGSENTDWAGTPLQCLYEKHKKLGKNEKKVFNHAAIDLGWILKNVLFEDERIFDSKNAGKKCYRWLENKD